MNRVKPQGKPWTQEATHKTLPRGQAPGNSQIKFKRQSLHSMKKILTGFPKGNNNRG